MALPLLVEYLEAGDWSWRRVRLGVAWLVVPPVVTIAAWAAYLQHSHGSCRLLFDVEKLWGKQVSPPWTTVRETIRHISQEDPRNVYVLDLMAIAVRSRAPCTSTRASAAPMA